MTVRVICSAFAMMFVALFFTASAFGDIKAYNAAVTAGDFKQAAIEAKAVWAEWDRKDADTALVAREFGYISYVAGDYPAARDYGQFLKDNGKSLATPDDQPVASAVLLAIANFRLKPDDKTRDELFNTLKQRQTAPNIDRLSMLAAEALYAADLGSRDYRRAAESAEVAYAILSEGGNGLTIRSLNARAVLAISRFMGKRDKGTYLAIADSHDAIVDALDAATNAAQRGELIKLKFLMQAWTISVEAYLLAEDRFEKNVVKRFQGRSLKTPANAIFPESTPPQHRCKSEFLKGNLRYPRSAAFKGLVGTVILKMDVDNEGRISNPEVLASVPEEQFAEEVLKSMPTARFRPASDAKPGCLMFSPSHVFMFSFNFE